LNGKLAGYEENPHFETDKGDVLVIGECLCVESENLNPMEPLALERKFYRIWKKYSLDSDKSALIFVKSCVG
jgi:hypothetical protein